MEPNKNQNGIRVCASNAHFISLGNGRLSTGVSIYEIHEIGNLTIGSSNSCDIIIKGIGVLDVHCTVSRKKSSDGLDDVYLTPYKGKVLVEGVSITDECLLQQGSMITIGESSYLRFNFPRKAEMLKNNAMGQSSHDNYDDVLKKSLNTNYINFAEFNSDKTFNNSDKVTEKMKNPKIKTNETHPNKLTNLQVYPFATQSIDNTTQNQEEMQQLEQVLKMFVEYNNNNIANETTQKTLQTSSDKINGLHQNRIKTNGSLPKNFHTKEHGSIEFYDSDSKSTDDIEVYRKPNSPRTRIKTFVSSPTNASPRYNLSPTDNNDKSLCDQADSIDSNAKDYEKLIKSFEEKFRMEIHNIQNCETANTTISMNGDSNGQASDMNSEKNEILSKIRQLKILISDIQYQESEVFLESDVEKSLVQAETDVEATNLNMLNEKLSALKHQMKQFEIQRLHKQKQQEIQQIKLKNVIKDKEAEIKMLQEQQRIKNCSPEMEKRLNELLENLEVDKKTYEDLEFNYLEEEAEWLSLLEEYKDNYNNFSKQIDDKKKYLQQLEQTKRANENLTHEEQKTLEKKLFDLKQKLESEREKLKSIDRRLSTKSSKSVDESNLTSNSLFDSPSFDRNSNVMSKSFNENMFYNRSKIEVSHFDFDSEMNHSITEQKPNNTARNSNSDHNSLTMKKLSQTNISELVDFETSSPLMMPKYHSLSSLNFSNDKLVPYSKTADEYKKPTTEKVVQRQIPKHKRPLTRYLPNFSLSFNLKQHIESAGHQLQLCPHVIIDATSCRGYLNKLGGKPLFSNLRANNRWFVFDRERMMLVYYSDKHEKKPRGGAYFNAITDVYFDHSSNKSNRTFIVKTKSRIFTLQAPSSQACSIWIDVIITGAQGKMLEYEK